VQLGFVGFVMAASVLSATLTAVIVMIIVRTFSAASLVTAMVVRLGSGTALVHRRRQIGQIGRIVRGAVVGSVVLRPTSCIKTAVKLLTNKSIVQIAKNAGISKLKLRSNINWKLSHKIELLVFPSQKISKLSGKFVLIFT